MATADTMVRGHWASAWRGQRLVFAGFGVLVLLCTGWTVLGRDALLSTIATCHADRAGCTPTRLAEMSVGPIGRLQVLGVVGIAVPALSGVFWGAPMIARVLETGPGRLPADGAGRVRWYLAGLGLAAVGTASAATLLALLVAWWWRPAANTLYGLDWYEPVILYSTGPGAVAAALFGLAAGSAAGLLARRTLPAMITTVVGVLGVRWLLHAAHRYMVAPQAYTAEGNAPVPGPDGAWWTGWGYLTADGGRAPATACPFDGDTAGCEAQHGFTGSFHTAYPPSDFWTFQGLDTAVLLVLAAVLAALVVRLLYRRSPAAPAAGHAQPPHAVTAWLVPLIPAVVMFGLGLWGLTRQDTMWRDEAATWQTAHRSVTEICNMLSEVDLVHGLYYVLMHGLFDFFGDSLYSLRLPSVLAMASTAAFTGLIGARLAGPTTGISAGTALSLIPVVQKYAQEGRSYALVTAGVAAATWLLVKALDRPERRMLWAAYAATVWLTALLNWFSLFAVGAHLLTLVLAHIERRVLGRWAAAAAVAVTGTLPLILASRAQSGQVSWIPPLTWSTLITPTVLLLISALCARLPHRANKPLTLPRLALPLLAIPQITLLLISTVKPLYLDRYLLYSYIGLALLLGLAAAAAIRAAAARRFAEPWLLLPMATCATVALLAAVEVRDRSSSGRVDDVIAIANETAYYARPGDAVVFLPAARRDTALVTPWAFAALDDIALEQTPTASGTLKGLEIPPQRIRTVMLARQRIILVTDAYAVARPPGTDRECTKQQVLDKYFHKSHETQLGGRRVGVYDRN